MNGQIVVKERNQKKFVACPTGLLLVKTEQDILDLLAFCGENDTNLILFHADNFIAEFYDLKSGLAGTVLQKFSNYHIKSAIVVDFSKITSQRFRELILECNRGQQLRFFKNVSLAIEWLTA